MEHLLLLRAGEEASVKLFNARVLFLILAWLGISPLQATAQLVGTLITSPSPGSTVSKTITVSASVGLLVTGVQFKLDGRDLGREDTTAPYSISWNTSTAANGTHTLTAVARFLLLLPLTSDPVSITVFNDNTGPTVAITSPASAFTVSSTITVSANASDNVGVSGVQFKLDGLNLGPEDTVAPYSVSWDTATANGGPHVLTAVARDAVGNRTTSNPVTVTVAN